MATNQELITQALTKLGFGSNIESSLLDNSFQELRNMIFELEGNDIDILYDDTSGLTDETGIDKRFWSAVVSLLAKRVSESVGIPVSIQLEKQASIGVQTLLKNTSNPATWKHPSRMPYGSGNNRRSTIARRYYNEGAQEETAELVTVTDDTAYTLVTED